MKVFGVRWASLPATIKVPLVAVMLMMIVSIILTNQVLSRLREMQERHLASLAGTYLDGLSSAVLPHVLRDDIWEVFDTLDRSRFLYASIGVGLTIVADESGRVIAASDPGAAPNGTLPPSVIARHLPGNEPFAIDLPGERAYIQRLVTYQGRPVGRIYAEANIAPLLAERRATLRTLIATNTGLTLVFAALGYLLVRRLIRPLNILLQYIEGGRSGPVPLIPEADFGPEQSEFGRLFRRFNAMAEAVNERELLARTLTEEERLASLGRLASGMAHEINNPLGGLFTAVDTLKRHGQDPTTHNRALALIERGLAGIRDVVRATLLMYRSEGEERSLSATDLDDLRLLIAAEVKRKDLRWSWSCAFQQECTVPAGPIRQALLNLLLNACTASSPGGILGLSAACTSDMLRLEISNGGDPMPESVRRSLSVAPGPFRPVGSGLGLWIVHRIVRDLAATITAGPGPGGAGAIVVLMVPLAGPDGGNHAA